jgi:hypothetical protein
MSQTCTILPISSIYSWILPHMMPQTQNSRSAQARRQPKLSDRSSQRPMWVDIDTREPYARTLSFAKSLELIIAASAKLSKYVRAFRYDGPTIGGVATKGVQSLSNLAIANSSIKALLTSTVRTSTASQCRDRFRYRIRRLSTIVLALRIMACGEMQVVDLIPCLIPAIYICPNLQQALHPIDVTLPPILLIDQV